MKILMVHGRAQGGKDEALLKGTWISTLEKGLALTGKSLPAGIQFDFPFYGDVLDKFTAQSNLPTPADVIAKGPGQNLDFERFLQSVLFEIYETSDISESQVDSEMADIGFREKGPQNWRWIQAIARAVDRRFGDATDWAIEIFLKDVFLYLNSKVVRDSIDSTVKEYIVDSKPTVVIGHSLGSLVAYRVMRDHPVLNPIKYITIGSPLGLRAISTRLGIPENAASQGWYNAFDERDIVALNPLDDDHFPTEPAIVNNNAIRNGTSNRHGIEGYLSDSAVASVIANAIHSVV